ncbi:MAG: putative lyase [Pedosphaera sp.]|nr:putative lyase [Pedosphaera sp.]
MIGCVLVIWFRYFDAKAQRRRVAKGAGKFRQGVCTRPPDLQDGDWKGFGFLRARFFWADWQSFGVRKRIRILFVVLIVAVVGGIGWVVWRSREPVYQGKRLSEWLQRYDNPFPVYHSAYFHEADEAVRHIGTNAIPTLLRKLRAKDFPFAGQLLALSRKQHIFNFNYTSAATQWQEGYLGFRALGAEGREVVPELLAMYENKSLGEKAYIARSLGAIGPAARAAVPALVRGLADMNRNSDYLAAIALGEINSEPELAVPALVKWIGHQRSVYRLKAADLLGHFDADAKPAIPALLELLEDGDPSTRLAAGEALARIDPEATAKFAVPVLVKILGCPDSNLRATAAQALGRFGSGASSAVPPLLTLLDDSNSWVKSAAKDALIKIDPVALAAAHSNLRILWWGSDFWPQIGTDGEGKF